MCSIMLYKDILAWSEKGLTIDSLYPNDDWSPLQFSAAVGNLDTVSRPFSGSLKAPGMILGVLDIPD